MRTKEEVITKKKEINDHKKQLALTAQYSPAETIKDIIQAISFCDKIIDILDWVLNEETVERSEIEP